MSEVEPEQRKEQIASLYRKVLEREPDDPGLNSYLYSDASIEEIEAGMRVSGEFQELERKKSFGKQLERLGTGELLLMGSSPRGEEHVESLKNSGVQAVLRLDQSFERPYDHSWCEHYCNVPIPPGKSITEEQASEILDFIYTNVVIGGRKTFIHSDLGSSRSPMAIILFLMAEKGMSFMVALNVVTAKQNRVNPDRSLITGKLVNFVKSYKFKDSGKPRSASVSTQQIKGSPGKLKYVGLSPNLFVGTKLTDEMIAEFREGGIDVVVDLNDSRTKLPPEAGWFSHIHLPLADDKIKEMMPVVLRNVNKYTRRGRAYVMCSVMPKLLMFAENLASNSDDPLLKERLHSIRPKILSL